PTEKTLREIFVMDRLGIPAASNVLTPKFSETADPKTAERQIAVGEAAQPVLRPALSEPAALEKVGTGVLTALSEHEGRPVYGRSLTVAALVNHDRVLLLKWSRRLRPWTGRPDALPLWSEKPL